MLKLCSKVLRGMFLGRIKMAEGGIDTVAGSRKRAAGVHREGKLLLQRIGLMLSFHLDTSTWKASVCLPLHSQGSLGHNCNERDKECSTCTASCPSCVHPDLAGCH